MVAAAITKGDITLHNVIPKHMEPITAKLRAAGCEVEEFDDALRIQRTGELKPLKLKTMPHPGFPTDMQPLMTALLTLAKGKIKNQDAAANLKITSFRFFLNDFPHLSIQCVL